MQFDLSGFDISEFTEARILVECAIIPLATRRIFPAMLSKLENELRLIEENADNPQIADQHDRDFHLLLLQASGNRVLQVFSDVLIAYFEKTRESLPDNDCQYFLDTASKQRDIVVYQKRRCPNGFRVNASSFTGKENIALNLSKTKTQPENLSGVSAM